jgi:hypothetical protein
MAIIMFRDVPFFSCHPDCLSKHRAALRMELSDGVESLPPVRKVERPFEQESEEIMVDTAS